MHLLNTTAATLDGLDEPVDLRQPPAPMAVLSFTDSDLSGLGAAWAAERAAERDVLPDLRLVPLRALRHPMSADLWLDRTGSGARVVLLRLLGGLEWWRYGAEQLSALARARGIALAVLPGEDRDDPRLLALGTMPEAEQAALLAYFREGGPYNLRALLRRLAGHAGVPLAAAPPRPVPRAGFWRPGQGVLTPEAMRAALPPGRPVVPVVFYRSLLLADDAAPVAALAAALEARGLAAAPVFVSSLKDAASLAVLRPALEALAPDAIVATTAFGTGEADPLSAAGAPVFQAVIASTAREAWASGARGLGAADLAMHVVLPELDGRVLAGALSFKAPEPPPDGLDFERQANRPEPDRVAAVADRVVALVRLRRTPRAARRIAILLPDYPGAGGRTGYAVGLDGPASVLALLEDLRAAGYDTGSDAGTPPATPRALVAMLDATVPGPPLADHVVPEAVRAAVQAAWGDPAGDPDARDGVFRFRALTFGRVTVAVAPDRGRPEDRRADWHDPALPPRHALLAFGAWLRAGHDAVVHMGAHGALEWLPGKAVALTRDCFPEAVLGPLPVIYPFLVSNPGEAAQAKRRIAAVTLGHLPPNLAEPELSGPLRDLERLLDEYAAADGLDRRRRERLAGLILDAAARAGVLPPGADPDDALRQVDALLCDVKEMAIKDGLHVLGRAAPEDAPARVASAAAERAAVLAALDGRHVPAGPGGAPARGRRDVLPTGRNLHGADPRGLPTETATGLGRLAAEEVVRAYLQEHGEMPRAVVLDLWGSATLRTGGEEIAQGLALMGCRPIWDPGTGRVRGVEALPPASMGRPRVDVTWRLSGLFRDLFPAGVALLDAATRAVAARDESDEENPLAAARRAGADLGRVFGTAPGAYGAGPEALLASGGWSAREELGRAYLAAASHAYDGAAGEGRAAPDAFAARVAAADALVHPGDDPNRDLLEGGAGAAHIGGFAAAAAMLGRAPDLIALDTTAPGRPRARPLDRALARLVHGRATDPRFVAGMMRHGPRGAAELAETVDRLVAFAETTRAVPPALLDAVHDCYLGDPAVLAFLRRENPAAARAIAARLRDARRRGLWQARRNDVDAALDALLGAA